MLEQAIKYFRLGLSVIPCRKDKTPLVPWVEWQNARPGTEQLTKWWNKYRKANCGIVTGKISGVDVLDLDSEDAYRKINDEFIGESVETPVLKTPSGGYQVWFKHKPGLSTRAQYMPDVDVRSDGGFAVAPVSYCDYEKRGKHVRGSHEWLNGLNPFKIEAAPWPSFLFDTLMQCSYSSSSCLNNIINSNSHANENRQSITNRNISFNEGGRDDTIFHLAWHLRKGGMSREEIEIYTNFVGQNCVPPFPPEEISKKIASVFDRKKRSETGLTAAIKDYLSVTSGNFSVTNLIKALQGITNEDRGSIRAILHRMAKEGKYIERDPKNDGIFRVIDNECQPLDWVNATCEYKELWLPLGLGEICGVQPGNVLVFAGAKDSGKTAFLMNTAKENRHTYKVHYFNSEMGMAEWKMRASKFDDITIEQLARGVMLYDRNANFADVVKSGEGNLNIIDFLEVPDEVWRVGSMIQKIHAKLNGALCIIALQKKIGQDLGRGAEFSMEKARLYISLDYQKAKIVSCKNFKENDIIAGNPRGYTCRYKLVQGCKIIKQPPGWASPTDKEAA
jgi:hypothetical protein